MASVALDPAYRRISVEEFLEMDLGDGRAELVDGVIHMMAGGRKAHNRIQMNIASLLRQLLRGSGCRPYGPDQAVRTGEREIRYPDVSVYCGDANDEREDDALLIGDPKVVVEVMSESTKDYDQRWKLPEYQTLAGVEATLFVYPEDQKVRLVTRSGPSSWKDRWLARGEDVPLDCLGITLPHAEIFARD